MELIKIEELFKARTIDELKKELISMSPDFKIETTHKFSGGMYARTFFPKKDSFIIGKIHKFAGFNVLLKGSVIIYDGKETKKFDAPFTWEAPANTQKIGYFTEDSEFMSVSTCFADNVDDAENELYYDDDVTIEQVYDWMDYDYMLYKTGLTEEEVQILVNKDNLLENSGLQDFELKDSPIHGVGYFTTVEYKNGDKIGEALIRGDRTELGRWVNNSCRPNTVAEFKDSDNGMVYASRDILKGEELTISYIDNLSRRIL